MSAGSVLSEEQRGSMEEPYEEFSQSTKIIILLQCSLQTARNKLSKSHWRKNLPQSNVKPALDSESFCSYLLKRQRSDTSVKGNWDGNSRSKLPLSQPVLHSGYWPHEARVGIRRTKMMWHLIPGKLQGRILEDLCIHHLLMIPWLLKTTHNLEISAWVSSTLGFSSTWLAAIALNLLRKR